MCSAHRFQLSVRVLLGLSFISDSLEKVRKTVRFFRRSCVASTFLIKAFGQAHEFSKPLRPLLDVRTRWGSTIAMLKRYLKIESVLSNAHFLMMKDGVRFTDTGPADPLTPREKALVEVLITVLGDTDASTTVLGKAHHPTVQDVDVLTAGTIALLDSYRVANQSDSDIVYFTDILRNDILARRLKHFKSCPMAELLCQVSTFLTPAYNSMEHLAFLGDIVYRNHIDKALFLMLKVSAVYFNSSSTTSTGQERTDPLHPDQTDEAPSVHRDGKTVGRMMEALFKNAGHSGEIDDRAVLGNELKGYIANAKTEKGECPLAFWKRSESFYPHLAQIARLVFTPSACSTESERLFSATALLRSKRRSMLSAENTEVIVKVGNFLNRHYSTDTS